MPVRVSERTLHRTGTRTTTFRALFTLRLQALVERQNKELSDLLWRRGEAERLLIQAETTFAQVSRANERHASASLTPPAQESAAAAALSAGAEGPEHVKEAESRLKKLDKELHEERQ